MPWRRFCGRVLWRLTAAAALVLFLLFGRAWENDSPRTGLIQRANIVVGWVWLGLLFADLAVRNG